MRLVALLIAVTMTACPDPTVETDDLSRACETVDDCIIRTEIPCYRCLQCEGVAIARSEADRYDQRLFWAGVMCPWDSPWRVCGPCASDSIARNVDCIDGQCTAVP